MIKQEESQGLGLAPAADPSEIEWRPQGKAFTWDNRNQCNWVPYLRPQTVARLLDEWVGPFNWEDSYEPSAGGKAMWCRLRVRASDTDDWVTKTDVGTPSNWEAEKGTVSDAFKRAATLKWGVGRNVYELPKGMRAPCEVDRQGNPRPAADTMEVITAVLEAAGYKAGGVAVEDLEPSDSAPDEPQSSPEPASGTRQRTEVPEAAQTPMERINALGLRGQPLTKLRTELQQARVSWPPVSLDPAELERFNEVMAPRETAKAS